MRTWVEAGSSSEARRRLVTASSILPLRSSASPKLMERRDVLRIELGRFLKGFGGRVQFPALGQNEAEVIVRGGMIGRECGRLLKRGSGFL